MFSDFANNFYAAIAKIPFDWLVWFTWGSYAFIFVIAFGLTLLIPKVKALSKTPFLCLTNAYAAVNLSLYLLKCELAPSILVTALFWVIGYILYGLLCFCSKGKHKNKSSSVGEVITTLPAPSTPAPMPSKAVKADIPAAKNSVRLEHAVTVTEKLLTKCLGKSDRQEVEKIKNTLAILRIKGTLSTTEAEILNENFNTLLKLMAKYNV